MIIGSLSHISYTRFAMSLAPVALIGLIINFLIVWAIYRNTLNEEIAIEEESSIQPHSHDHERLLKKSLFVTAGVIALFFMGAPIALVSLCGAAVLLLDRVPSARVYQSVDWPLLVMFAALFVLVRGFEVQVVRHVELTRWTVLKESPVVAVSTLSAVLSNLVSNVPAVLLFQPIVTALPPSRTETAWLALAMSSTLAGNVTILGSVANLIVVENARRARIELGFVEYLRVGVPLTLLTMLVGIAWLIWMR